MQKNKIALLFRKKISNRHSIENLFAKFQDYENISFHYLPCNLSSIRSLFRIFLFVFREKIDAKILHITGDVQYMAIFYPFKKIIITVHDTYHIQSLNGIKKNIYLFFWFYLPFLIANKIVAISEETKRNLIELFPSFKNKIVTINNGITLKNFTRIKTEKNNKILAIGSSENKNIIRLIEAIKITPIKFELVILGKQNEIIIDALNSSGLKYRIFVDLNEEELNECYLNSEMLFFASTQEGFGLPIIEGQHYGIPIITSKIEPMKSIAGDGAVLVNPYSVEEIANAIQELHYNINFKLNIIEKGFVNKEKFNFEIFKNNYFELYEQVKN